MTSGEAETKGQGVAWYGWVLCLCFALAPLLGWLSPLAFAPLVALGGLLTIGGVRVSESERPAALAVLVLVTWAVASMAWSPFTPTSFESATALKLVAQGLLYWSLLHAAGAAAPQARLMALRILSWGMALLGVVLVAEALTGAGGYQALRQAMGDPIRPDLAVKNIAQGGFVLAVLAPTAVVAGWRTGAGVWLALPIAAGIIASSMGLNADAPVIALVLCLLAGWATWRWPVVAPRVVALFAGASFLAAPWIVLATRKLGWFQVIEANVPLSWSMRMSYWRHAADWIGDHPLRGWGIDASRMFAPGIRLHPHNGALQVWLELGLIGAMSAAVFWAVTIASQSSPQRDLGRAGAVATAMAYLTFSAVSFGVWQEWWLAVGALAAAACLAVQRQGARENS